MIEERPPVDRPPTSVDLMCRCGALLVGSYASYLVGETKQFNDFDLIVPQDKWLNVMASVTVKMELALNSFGGISFRDRAANKIDVWPSSIEHYLRNVRPGSPSLVVDWIGRLVYRKEVLDISQI